MKDNKVLGILIFAVIALVLLLSSLVYATATSETGDTRAKPVTLYGKTSGGVLKSILTDSSGVVQIA